MRSRLIEIFNAPSIIDRDNAICRIIQNRLQTELTIIYLVTHFAVSVNETIDFLNIAFCARQLLPAWVRRLHAIRELEYRVAYFFLEEFISNK